LSFYTIGIAYENYSGNLVPPKQLILPDCICQCRALVSNEEIISIFNSFYGLPNHETQHSYLKGSIEVNSYEELANANRRRIFRYKLALPLRQIYVCRRFFCAIHDIQPSRLRRKVIFLEAIKVKK